MSTITDPSSAVDWLFPDGDEPQAPAELPRSSTGAPLDKPATDAQTAVDWLFPEAKKKQPEDKTPRAPKTKGQPIPGWNVSETVQASGVGAYDPWRETPDEKLREPPKYGHDVGKPQPEKADKTPSITEDPAAEIARDVENQDIAEYLARIRSMNLPPAEPGVEVKPATREEILAAARAAKAQEEGISGVDRPFGAEEARQYQPFRADMTTAAAIKNAAGQAWQSIKKKASEDFFAPEDLKAQMEGIPLGKGVGGKVGEHALGATELTSGILSGLWPLSVMKHAMEVEGRTAEETGDYRAALGQGLITVATEWGGIKVAAGHFGKKVSADVFDLWMSRRFSDAAKIIAHTSGAMVSVGTINELGMVLEQLHMAEMEHQSTAEAISYIQQNSWETFKGGAGSGLFMVGLGAIHSAIRMPGVRQALGEQMRLYQQALETGRDPFTGKKMSEEQRLAVKAATETLQKTAEAKGWKPIDIVVEDPKPLGRKKAERVTEAEAKPEPAEAGPPTPPVIEKAPKETAEAPVKPEVKPIAEKPKEAVEKPAPTPPIKKEAPKVEEKQPWEMTREEILAPYKTKARDNFFPSNTRLGKIEARNAKSERSSSEQLTRKYHREQVESALAAGKPVPPEVLADYPDLQKEPTDALSAQEEVPKPEVKPEAEAKPAEKAEPEDKPEEEVLEAPEVSPADAKKAERLRTLADNAQKHIDEKRRDMTQNPTPKRMAQYHGRRHDADNLERMQRAMRAIADATEAGTLPPILADVKTKKDILSLVYKGLEGGGYYDVIPSHEYSDTSAKGKALQKLMEGAKSEAQREKDVERKAEEKLTRLEEDVRFTKIPGFFPTPKPVIDRMLEEAEIEPEHTVLEPSAGKGDIADAIWDAVEVEADLHEVSPKLVEILRAKDYTNISGDFMEQEAIPEYDRVVMNPPFEKSQDIKHVQHAYGFLKPGGRLVAIMSEGSFGRTTSPAPQFREWLEEVGGTSELLEPGSFKSAFRSTGVEARMVVIEKPEEAEKPDAGGEGVPMAAAPLPAPPDAVAATRAGRIQPSPIPPPAGGPKQLKAIIFDIGKAIGRKVRTAKPSRGALGTYYPGTAKPVIRFAGDLDVTAHELAHSLDDRFNLVGEWAGPRKRSPFDSELLTDTFQQTIKKSYSLTQKRAEAVAEWVRGWLVNPDAARTAAPGFFKHFEKTVPAEVRDKLKSFSDDIRQWVGATATERTLANVEMELTPKKLSERALRENSQGFDTGWIDRVSATTLDSLSPLWKGLEYAKMLRGIKTLRPSLDPKILVRTHAGYEKKFYELLDKGPTDAKNKPVPGVGGIDWLLEPLDSSSKKSLERDMGLTAAMMINERVVERSILLAKEAAELAQADRALRELRAELRKAAEAGEISTKDTEKMVKDLAREVSKLRKSLGYTGKISGLPRFVMGRTERMAGTGGGIYSDLAQAKQAIKELEKDPETLTRLKEAAKRYRAFSDSILQYAKDKGRLSQEQLDGIRKRNAQYVAMLRIFEASDPEMYRSSGGKRLASVRSVVQKFKGSTRPIQNPYVSLIQQSHSAIREADRNEAMIAIRNLLTKQRGMYEGTVLNLSSIGSQAKSGDEDTIKIFVDGKAEYWQFQSDIHKALKGWAETESSNIVWKALQVLPRLTRSAITHSPPFMARNFIRDQMHRAVLSETGSKPWGPMYYATPKGMHTFREDIADFHRFGGGLFGHYGTSPKEYYRQLKGAIQKASKGGGSIISTPAMIARGYHKFAASSEIAGRLVEFRTAYKKAREELGYDEYDAGLYAAYQARELMDFAVGGTAIRSLNKYVIFLNAAIQGTARTVRGARQSPKRFMTRWLAYIASIEMAVYAWNLYQGDDEEWSDLPQYQKDFFWNVKIGANTWLRIPKPWEIGVLASGLSRGIEAARGDKKAFEGYGRSILQGFMPVDEGAVFGPLKVFGEAITNYDIFRERNIVPVWEAGVDLELREGTKRASRIGQIVQKAIGVDARHTDHLVEGMLGSTGRMMTQASDIGREDKPSAEARALSTTIGLLAQSPAYASPDVRYVLEWATSKKKGTTRPIKGLRAILRKSIEAETAEERDAAAKKAREVAKKIRTHLEKIEAAEKK